MAESERRRNYRYNRVMIESARILDPQFSDAVVYLTGAQIELLRNVTQYLNRLETYVTEYADGYYLAPTAEDYDSILEIVADLEETLMGNPNTLWGYKETYRDSNAWPDASAGTQHLTFDAIPAGSVGILEGLSFKNDDTVLTRVIVKLMRDSEEYALVDIANPTADVWHCYSFDKTMEAGDYIEIEMQGVVLNDYLRWQMLGCLMDVPT